MSDATKPAISRECKKAIEHLRSIAIEAVQAQGALEQGDTDTAFDLIGDIQHDLSATLSQLNETT